MPLVARDGADVHRRCWRRGASRNPRPDYMMSYSLFPAPRQEVPIWLA